MDENNTVPLMKYNSFHGSISDGSREGLARADDATTPHR
jgi:hypothetical protein